MYKDIFLNRKAVVFDLDGTIVETHPIWLRAHNIVLRDIGVSDHVSPEDYVEVGQSMLENWERFLEKYDVDKRLTAQSLTETTNRTYLNLLPTLEVEPKPGFWTLAAKVKEDMKLKLGLVSNTPRHIGEQVLKIIGLEASLDATVFGDEVANKKPQPDMYFKIAQELDVTPKELVVFEDSIVGATAAAKAKMDLVIIISGNNQLRDYPGNILFADYDFDGLAAELQATYKEYWNDVIEDLTEKISG
jgi:HAD superfamily hydrolase (TIGR01509 family)